MAYVTLPVRIEYYIHDTDPHKTRTTGVYLPATTPAADVASFALSYATLLLALLNASLTHFYIIKSRWDATAPYDSLNADVRRVGAFVFSTETAGQRAVIAIPSVDSSIVLSSGPWAGQAIDTDNVEVAEFLTTITDNTAPVRICDPENNKITALSVAYRQHRIPPLPPWQMDRL